MPDGRHPGRAPHGAPGSGRNAGGRVACDLVGQGPGGDCGNRPGSSRRADPSRVDDCCAGFGGRTVRGRRRTPVRTEELSDPRRLRRSIRLVAPVALARSAGREFDLELSSDDFRISGPRRLVLSATFGIAVCKLTVAVLDDDAAPTKVTARLGKHKAETELRAAAAAGRGDCHQAGGRGPWGAAVPVEQERAGDRCLHPSLKRYLGPKSEQYPGQDELHFRVLLAEVVAEALCARRLQGNIEANPRDFEGMSWDDYYRHFARMISEFLPKAHGLMAPGV